MDVITAIKSRRSVRRFSDRLISKELLLELVNCGRLAPSGHNKQGRHFLVLTEQEKINGVGRIATYAKFIPDKVHACILVFCDAKECLTLLEDGAAGTENILLAATDLGLASCWVAGYGVPYSAEIERFVAAPANMKLISIIALGYPDGDSPVMPLKKELQQVLHWNQF